MWIIICFNNPYQLVKSGYWLSADPAGNYLLFFCGMAMYAWHKPKNSARIHHRSLSLTHLNRTLPVWTPLFFLPLFSEPEMQLWEVTRYHDAHSYFKRLQKKHPTTKNPLQKNLWCWNNRTESLLWKWEGVWSSSFQSSTNWCIASCCKCQFNRSVWSERGFRCELYLTPIF